GKRFTAATASTTPTIAVTTRISTSVKPPPRFAERGRPSAGGGPVSFAGRGLIPVPDVGTIPLAPAGPVGAKAEDVDLAAHAGAEVLVVTAPGILRQS